MHTYLAPRCWTPSRSEALLSLHDHYPQAYELPLPWVGSMLDLTIRCRVRCSPVSWSGQEVILGGLCQAKLLHLSCVHRLCSTKLSSPTHRLNRSSNRLRAHMVLSR